MMMVTVLVTLFNEYSLGVVSSVKNSKLEEDLSSDTGAAC